MSEEKGLSYAILYITLLHTILIFYTYFFINMILQIKLFLPMLTMILVGCIVGLTFVSVIFEKLGVISRESDLVGLVELWYQCCKALKIEDEDIAKVVGKWAMPAFEKKFKPD